MALYTDCFGNLFVTKIATHWFMVELVMLPLKGNWLYSYWTVCRVVVRDPLVLDLANHV